MGWIGPGIGVGGAVPDGDLVPDLTWRLLKEGKYQQGIEKVLVGNPINDGQYATIYPATTWEEQLKFFMKTPTQDTISRVSSLYPQNFTEAADLFAGDVVFKCHSYFLASAFTSNAYKYYMSIPPATHGQDQIYYFHDLSAPSAAVEFPRVAQQLQEYFKSMIVNGYTGGSSNSCDDGRPYWPSFSSMGRWMNISNDGFSLEDDNTDEARRCELILDTMNDPMNGW